MTDLIGTTTSYVGGPRFNGANIDKYIGFKNFMFLVEDALLHHFRDKGFGPEHLYVTHGVGLELVEISTRLTNTMTLDDRIEAVVEAVEPRRGPGITAKVRLDAIRATGRVQVAGSKVRAVLVTEPDGNAIEPVPADLARVVVPEVASISEDAPETVPMSADLVATLAPENGFLWELRIPYYFCHWYTRMQSNAYVRILEEGTDRFLAHVGLGITDLLAERDWIPVVSRARVRMHADAFMGETMYISYVVHDIVRDIAYDSTLSCWVRRGDELVKVATLDILHGWALARGPERFQQMVLLDDEVQRALLNGKIGAFV
ncbi:thioesterase family protein [Nocardia brasiliensis]|uniref:thioesterase family protein n=1 Tax=Nocardia brasiliensis TaxID=37326 RepID=UPI0024590167|nr:hypothetical protein [Nocardia brasiliensis]